MGAGAQYPVPAVPSFQSSPEQTRTCQVNDRVLYFFERRNEGSSGVCQQPIFASCLGQRLKHSPLKQDATATPLRITWSLIYQPEGKTSLCPRTNPRTGHFDTVSGLELSHTGGDYVRIKVDSQWHLNVGRIPTDYLAADQASRTQ